MCVLSISLFSSIILFFNYFIPLFTLFFHPFVSSFLRHDYYRPGSRKYGMFKEEVILEVIREAFRFQTRTLQPRLLTAKTIYWLVEDCDELIDEFPLGFEEDEDGETLLECMLYNEDHPSGAQAYADLLIQCMHSLYHRCPEITQESPLTCLKEMIRNGWVERDMLTQYKRLYITPYIKKRHPTKKRPTPAAE